MVNDITRYRHQSPAFVVTLVISYLSPLLLTEKKKGRMREGQ